MDEINEAMRRKANKNEGESTCLSKIQKQEELYNG